MFCYEKFDMRYTKRMQMGAPLQYNMILQSLWDWVLIADSWQGLAVSMLDMWDCEFSRRAVTDKLLIVSQGVDLVRVEYLPDDKEDIIATARRLKERVGSNGAVFSSGGIGRQIHMTGALRALYNTEQ